MKKFSIGFSAMMIGLSLVWQAPVSRAAASAEAQVSFPLFPVTVNGTIMDVRHSEYPLLLYKDIIYFPMTWNNTAALGLSVEWDADNGLSLQKKDACVTLEQNLTPKINSNDVTQTAALAPFPVKVNGKPVVNRDEPYPLLLYRNITYFPMTWKFTHDEFGWSTSWDAERGYGIESCGGMSDSQRKQTDALNAANYGQLAVQGDWIYMNPASKYEGPNRLVKVKTDGSGEVKLSDDNARAINVVGDWLYYTVSDPSKNKMAGIFKLKTDGTERTQVSSEPIGQIWVQDDWVYYIHMTFQAMEGAGGGGYYKSDGIHRMKIDGTGDQELVRGEGMFQFFLDAGRIYFLMQEDAAAPDNLYRMNDDGSGRIKLQNGVTRAFVIDGWIYYIQNNGKQLNKMSTDGSVNIPLYTSEHWITSLNYRQGWIYIVNGTFGILGSAYIDKLRIDGTGHAGLGQARATALYIAGRSLYYPQAWEGNNRLEKIDIGE